MSSTSQTHCYVSHPPYYELNSPSRSNTTHQVRALHSQPGREHHRRDSASQSRQPISFHTCQDAHVWLASHTVCDDLFKGHLLRASCINTGPCHTRKHTEDIQHRDINVVGSQYTKPAKYGWSSNSKAQVRAPARLTPCLSAISCFLAKLAAV